jgi:hypothetical protein
MYFGFCRMVPWCGGDNIVKSCSFFPSSFLVIEPRMESAVGNVGTTNVIYDVDLSQQTFWLHGTPNITISLSFGFNRIIYYVLDVCGHHCNCGGVLLRARQSNLNRIAICASLLAGSTNIDLGWSQLCCLFWLNKLQDQKNAWIRRKKKRMVFDNINWLIFLIKEIF